MYRRVESKMTASDGETKIRLLKAAKEEFLEKGYLNASLRNICRNAGVTTGALYFLFKDKEDLFAQLVETPIRLIDTALRDHLTVEATTFSEGYNVVEGEADDLDVSGQILNIMFKYKDECLLLLTKATGSRFENIKDNIVAELEANYRQVALKMEETNGYEHVDDYTLHYMTHMQVEAFIYLLTHSKDRDEALREMPYILRHMRGGWFSVFGAI